MMELTDAAGVAREGWWRIPMFRSTPDPTLAYEVLGTHMRYATHTDMCSSVGDGVVLVPI